MKDKVIIVLFLIFICSKLIFNYINRNIEKYTRVELGSLDSENIEKYHNKRLEWQRYKEKFE